MRRFTWTVLALVVSGLAWAEGPAVALLPPVNRSGVDVPAEWIAEIMAAALADRGYALLEATEVDRFLETRRIRYTGGITEADAAALAAEADAGSALLLSIDDWDGNDPPRFALTARRVDASAGIVWCGAIGLHGWDRPGSFGRGRVADAAVLVERAAASLATALVEADAPEGRAARPPRVDGRFAPASLAVDPEWAASVPAEGRPRIAVLPFVTEGVRRDIGEVVALQFVRHLGSQAEGTVLEPGVVRAALLDARVIQQDGPSLSQVDALRALLDIDLVVSGRVTAYEGSGSTPDTPFVGFSARAIDAASRQVVWSSVSHARGDDGLRLFGTGHVRSAIELLSEQVRGVLQGVAERIETIRDEDSHP
jgi:hypothetical protein